MTQNMGPKTFTTSSAVEAKRLVKLDGSGNVEHCTATETDDPIGVTCFAAASGDEVAVDLLCYGRTFEMTASESLSVEDVAVAAADGKIAEGTGSTEHLIGIALEAASGDGSIVEVLPYDFNTINN